MSKFTIFTKEYEKELAECLSNEKTVETLSTKEGSYFTVSGLDFDLGKLVGIMENMTLAKNPVLTHSASLRQRIKEMVFAKKREALVRDLESFMQENTQMNWDGYLHFHFNEFTSRVNLILYSIVKKSITCFTWIYI